MAEAASVTLAEFTELLSVGAGVQITPDLVDAGTTFEEIGVICWRCSALSPSSNGPDRFCSPPTRRTFRLSAISST